MAKQKAPAAKARKRSTTRTATSRKRTSARKTRPAAVATRKSTAKVAGRSGSKPVKRPVAKPIARSKKVVAKRIAAKKIRRPAAVPRTRTPVLKRTAVARKAPALNRVRKTVTDLDIVPSPPSSLDLDRHATASRSGRHEMARRHEMTHGNAALTAGDLDADWESAYNVGDEAPGGDNPTPDQDVVDDIGRAVGIEYADNEEFKGESKVVERDRHRWELDPASAEDYKDR